MAISPQMIQQLIAQFQGQGLGDPTGILPASGIPQPVPLSGLPLGASGLGFPGETLLAGLGGGMGGGPMGQIPTPPAEFGGPAPMLGPIGGGALGQGGYGGFGGGFQQGPATGPQEVPGAAATTSGDVLETLQQAMGLGKTGFDLFQKLFPTAPEMSPATRAAFEAQRAGERADFSAFMPGSAIPAWATEFGAQMAGQAVPSGLTGISPGATFTGNILPPTVSIPAGMTAAGAAGLAGDVGLAAEAGMGLAGPAATGAGAGAGATGVGAGAAGLVGNIAQALPYLGALAGIGTTIAGDEPAHIKALDAAAYAGAPFTFGLTALLPTIAELTGLKKIFRGKPDIPHAVRESRELQRHAGQAQGFAGEIQQAQTLDQLYKTLLAHQTGYVGGTSPQAVDVAFPGRNYLGLYNLEPNQPGGPIRPDPWTQEQFFQAVRERPGELSAGIQAGVTPSMLTGMNASLADIIRSQVAQLSPPPPPLAWLTDPLQQQATIPVQPGGTSFGGLNLPFAPALTVEDLRRLGLL